MEVKITYCNSWNYRPVASRVEDEFLSQIPGANVSKIVGSGGNFIIEVDEKIIFSKKDLIGTEVNALPNYEEIVALVDNVKKSV